MKRLPLLPLIPLTAAAALVAVGCGGKAVDEPAGGDGDGDGDYPPPSPSDPLSDAHFPETFDRVLEDYCRTVVSCGAMSDQRECTSQLGQGFSLAFDLTSRACRGLFVDTFDCIERSFTDCESYSNDCYELGQTLADECAEYGDYDYDDYDY
jgi:hypothetical protein